MAIFFYKESDTMVYQKLTHTVKDFDVWKPGFVNNADLRKSHSCTKTRVYTEPGNKNIISVVMEWADKDQMKKFGESPALKEAMKHAGVVSPPEVAFQDNDFDVSNLEFQFETDG